MSEKIYRLHYRGQLMEGTSEKALCEAAGQCVKYVRQAQAQGKVLTAALYQADRMLFFYYEAIGEPLAVAEPIAMVSKTGGSQIVLPESGEDVQAACLRPDELLAPLQPYLQVWPGQAGDRLWVHMYHIYYHSVPKSGEDWRRIAVPEKRRGRIAFLREEKLFSYVYYHRAIVEEGLLPGDRYQSIALHENVLFSYFEEPKTMVNVRGDTSRGSEVIQRWLAADPEAHFIHMPEGDGGNFMFLPALFAVGVEDIM